MGNGDDGKKPYLLTAALVGVLLIVGGVVMTMVFKGSLDSARDKGVEIVAVDETNDEAKEIFVDVAGAVIKPGLYQLETGARINDALAKAGGLALEADRDWVSKNLNLALKIDDGVKLYIPFKGETRASAGGEVAGTSITGKVNINSASISELDTLWGVGEATAKKIVENRPYGSVEELLTKKVVKSNVYEEIKDEVAVY